MSATLISKLYMRSDQHKYIFELCATLHEFNLDWKQLKEERSLS